MSRKSLLFLLKLFLILFFKYSRVLSNGIDTRNKEILLNYSNKIYYFSALLRPFKR